MNYTTMAKSLGTDGFCQWPNFLTPASLSGLQNDHDIIQKKRGFQPAGTGSGAEFEVRKLVRRDEIHWINRPLANSVQENLWKNLDSLKTAFNRNLFLGLKEFSGHYALFPIGGFYKKHLDCFQHDNSRVVSLILYLNRNWKDEDGGELRVYSKDKTHLVDVQPIGGTLVCFLSREHEHEVLINNAPRSSFTGWFK